ncbi:MAG: hypothetical protein ABI673_00555 [Novosphingobium sp.]
MEFVPWVDVNYDNADTFPIGAWNQAFAVNLNGALLCSRAVIRSIHHSGA